MICQGSVHSTELYSPGCQMQQCPKCQHYRHLGNRCHALIKCAVCAGDHQLRSCVVRKNGGEYRCAPCNGAHTVYNPGCLEKQKQLDAVLKARKERPLQFATQSQPNPTVKSCEIAYVLLSFEEKFDPVPSISAGTNVSTTHTVSTSKNNISILEEILENCQAIKAETI